MYIVFPCYLLFTSRYLVSANGYLVVFSDYLTATAAYFWILYASHIQTSYDTGWIIYENYVHCSSMFRRITYGISHNLHIFVHVVSKSVAQKNSIKKVFLCTRLHTIHRNVWGNVLFSPNKNYKISENNLCFKYVLSWVYLAIENFTSKIYLHNFITFIPERGSFQRFFYIY